MTNKIVFAQPTMDAMIKADLIAEQAGLPCYSDLLAAAAGILGSVELCGAVLRNRVDLLARVMEPLKDAKHCV